MEDEADAEEELPGWGGAERRTGLDERSLERSLDRSVRLLLGLGFLPSSATRLKLALFLDEEAFSATVDVVAR